MTKIVKIGLNVCPNQSFHVQVPQIKTNHFVIFLILRNSNHLNPELKLSLTFSLIFFHLGTSILKYCIGPDMTDIQHILANILFGSAMFHQFILICFYYLKVFEHLRLRWGYGVVQIIIGLCLYILIAFDLLPMLCVASLILSRLGKLQPPTVVEVFGQQTFLDNKKFLDEKNFRD